MKLGGRVHEFEVQRIDSFSANHGLLIRSGLGIFRSTLSSRRQLDSTGARVILYTCKFDLVCMFSDVAHEWADFDGNLLVHW